jgi:2-polyprenyl-6-methoxyphenol hydroxylase-like FAD-dependent oxidoreductase
MTSTSDYDIIIIGARVAGSILAAILGEKGYRVLLMDRSTFPSDTISTHFFRAPALRAFNEIGIYKEIQSVAPHLKVNYNVIDGIEFPEPVDRPDDYPFYMCVRRIILDEILVRRVRQISNIELREGVRVRGLLWNNDYVKGIMWEDSNQRGEERAKVIVGADGVNSFLAKEVNVQAEHKEPVNRAMYYAYYSGITAKEGPAAEFHYKGNTLVYCFPTDSDLTLVAASIPISQFANFKRNLENEFNEVFKSMTYLAPRIPNAVRESPIRGSGNIPGYLRIPYGNGWALVGDAGMVMDPWSGQGMDQASTHALLLAKYLDNYFSGRQGWKTAMNAYHSDRNEFSLKTYKRTCMFSVDLRPMTSAALKRRGLSN